MVGKHYTKAKGGAKVRHPGGLLGRPLLWLDGRTRAEGCWQLCNWLHNPNCFLKYPPVSFQVHVKLHLDMATNTRIAVLEQTSEVLTVTFSTFGQRQLEKLRELTKAIHLWAADSGEPSPARPEPQAWFSAFTSTQSDSWCLASESSYCPTAPCFICAFVINYIYS